MYANAFKRSVLMLFMMLSAFAAKAQYNNEWIDFNKTYYKFKIGANGLYRLTGSTLASSGLGSVAAQDLQLWRNGVEVPIYTSVPSGSLGSSDYIEFWGEMNDGRPDSQLYKSKDYHLNKKWSLLTDTAVYFLTVNPGGSNKRLVPTANNVAGNVLPAEPYFIHTEGKYYRNKINSGYAVNAGLYVYSSDYDRGEGWTSPDIQVSSPNSSTFQNLYPYVGGPAASFNIALSGNDPTPHRYKVVMNGDSIGAGAVDFFIYERDTFSFPASKLTGSVNVDIQNTLGGRFVAHQYEMHYPRLFNFGGASNFSFILPASASGRYLEISNFSYGSTPPVLYDLTNGRRYVADISNPSLVRIVLQPSSQPAHFILVRQEASNITAITSLTSRTFTNYSLPQNGGNYLIISNPRLFSGPSGDPVEAYRLYRASVEGGGYDAKTYLIDDLVDQFAFGIKKNPLSIRNFLMYARAKFSVYPQNVFLLGKPMNYVHQRQREAENDFEQLSLVPTFGWPASDVMLGADPGTANPKHSIGRLSVINGQEVQAYLNKVKEYELAQKTQSPLVADKAWMKNVVHAVGGGSPAEMAALSAYLDNYATIISDTLFGGKVTSFTKTSTDAVQQIGGTLLSSLFQEGISLLTYFGHSSSTSFAFNLNTPENYNNQGKYPVLLALGCLVGDFFGYNSARLTGFSTLSEKYNLIPNRGTISFIASSHYGIPEYLDMYTSRLYKSFASKDYGKTLGEQMKNAIDETFAYTTQEDFYARITTQESVLHGDPAIRLNWHPKPDYAIEDHMLTVNPGFVSVADRSFQVKAKFLNLGKAIDRPLKIEVKREYPDQTSAVIYTTTIPGIRYADSIVVNVPLDPIRDKGTNKITVKIDSDEAVDELFETNNSVTKEVVVFEEEARPIYPAAFAIVSKQNIKFYASTANPFATSRTYRFEIDTTEKFNSPIKLTSNITSAGGVLEFAPAITFTDSTVYYWRIAPTVTSGPMNWKNSSFVYILNHQPGFNQSHYFQHTKSTLEKMVMDSISRTWKYDAVNNDVFIGSGIWGYGVDQETAVAVYINGVMTMWNSCSNYSGSLVFNVIDPQTFKPWVNTTALYGSLPNCRTGRQNNFEFYYTSVADRKKIMDFMEQVIPAGAYVIVRNFTRPPATTYINQWKADTSIYGSNKSIYHLLKDAGLTSIDSYTTDRPWILTYKKNDNSYTSRSVMGEGLFSAITMSTDMQSAGTIGYMTSPVFGPMKTWNQLQWKGSQAEAAAGDQPSINVIGIKSSGVRDTLFYNITPSQQTFDLSSVDASVYPYLQLRLKNEDTVHHTPYQLRYWRVTGTAVPEGAVAPNIHFTMKDSLELGEMLDFKLAFKNIADVNFDSLAVKMVITDKNNVTHTLPIQKLRPLATGDTVHVRYPLDTKLFQGMNTLYVHVNPDNAQPEQYQFNNFIYKTFYVLGDTLNPLLDVTFDNAHILNGDVVSARPAVMIRLQDETKWRLLQDTSLVTVKLRFPGSATWRTYRYDNDTLQFIPAQSSGNTGNVATVKFNPHLFEDGEYEMIVTGKDNSGNEAGGMEYRITFKVINKAMISNMLNYPNPFTTSTAFVFTITGSEVPQNVKIQILTVTGKIVREITKEELGPLRIGRNITEFKWDGTDQYGQKLGNGVYLYRVVTNLNGRSLDKYKDEQDNTDQFFNKGYGKMYLMR